MRENVEAQRPDLLALAGSEVSEDLFERASEGTRWAQPAIFCAALAGYEILKDRFDAGADGRAFAGRDLRSGGRRRD